MFYVFIIVIVSGIAVLVNMYYSRKRKKLILSLWDKNEKLDHTENFHETFTYLYENVNLNKEKNAVVDHITWHDLNLTKIFKTINFTFTSIGEELLYYRLKAPHETHLFEEKKIEKISLNKEYRTKLSLILSALGKAPYANSSKYIYAKPDSSFDKIYILLGLLPIIGLAIIGFSLQIGLGLFFISILVNSFLFYINRSKNEAEYESLFYCLTILLTSRNIAKLNQDTDFLKKTSKLKSAPFISVFLLKDDPTGTNLILQLFTMLKSIFLIDYFVFHYIVYLINNNSQTYELAWRKTAEIDLYYSIALWRKTLPYYCLPEYTDNDSLTIVNGYHPLVSNPVGNDFEFTQNSLLTGSNASGKSTFIKTIAVNIIFSQALNTSTSHKIRLTRGEVYSSMAMSDDIEKGQSYFLSEIKALKRIFDRRNNSSDMLLYVFMDEIFKGTNTMERVAAAESVLEYLNHCSNTKIMAATHDIELTEMLNDKYKNYHFREQIVDDEIIFDFLIKEGASNTRNAIELLRITGFPEKVYLHAVNKAKELNNSLI